VRNSIIHGNRRGGVSCIAGSVTLANNDITGNSGGGIVSTNASLTATNNTIAENTGIALSIKGGRATVVNNVIAFNVAGVYRYGNEIADVRCNDVYGNTSYPFGGTLAGYGSLNGNISVDPRIVSPYDSPHLQPDSPCIDGGDDSAVAVGYTDVDGQPRIQGSHVDIGADESDGTSWPAGARILHVSTAGDDGLDGLAWQTAKKTVSGALAAAQGGDEVWVAEGLYAEYVSVPAGVSLYGGFSGTESERDGRDWRAHATVLDQGKVTADFKNIVVDGLEIRNGTYAVTSHAGVVTIANCDIHGQLFGGIFGGNAAMTVQRNAIHNNRAGQGAGIYVNGGSLTLTGNVIRDNEASATDAGGGLWCNVNASVTNNVFTGNSAGSGGAIYWTNGSGMFTNNTVTGNTAKSGGALYCEAGGVTLHNNIVAFNSSGIYRFGGQVTGESSTNDIFGNTGYDFSGLSALTGQLGNVAVDPWLSNPFDVPHLQPGSPCIDAGNNSVVPSDDIDIDGQPRIQGPRVDIGADESDGTTWPTGGKTIYVTTSGDDGRDGLGWDTAKKTVRAAVAATTGGDEVWIAQGTYPVAVSVPAGVALYGGFTGGETRRDQRDWRTHPTVLAGSSQTAVTISTQNATLDGFTIQGGYGYKGGGVACLSATAHIANSVITNNFAARGSGVYIEGGVVTLMNNVITDNNVLGSPAESGGGVYCSGGRATLTGNVITRNVATSGGGVYADGGATVTLANNTVAGNNAPNGAVYTGAATTMTLVNDVVAFNSSGVKNDGGTITASHTDAAANDTFNYSGMADPTGQNGNISSDPRFVQVPASNWSVGGPQGDLHLTAASPCGDAGDDMSVEPGATDLDAKPRIQGVHVDMGAFEFSEPFTSPMADALRALRLAAGLEATTADDLTHLDADASHTVDTLDAALLARRAIGLETP
jgi:hypothetical protein